MLVNNVDIVDVFLYMLLVNVRYINGYILLLYNGDMLVLLGMFLVSVSLELGHRIYGNNNHTYLRVSLNKVTSLGFICLS